VWVLTKGGLVSVQHCRLYRTVVHVHHEGTWATFINNWDQCGTQCGQQKSAGLKATCSFC